MRSFEERRLPRVWRLQIEFGIKVVQDENGICGDFLFGRFKRPSRAASRKALSWKPSAGDTLHAMVASLRCVMENGAGLDEEPAGRLREVAERMEELLAHYRSVLTANRIQLPFRD